MVRWVIGSILHGVGQRNHGELCEAKGAKPRSFCSIARTEGNVLFNDTPNELFLVPASAARLVLTKAVVCAILSVGWCI